MSAQLNEHAGLILLKACHCFAAELAAAAVNLPGYSYDLTDTGVMAVLCPVNTFGPGLRKQRACVPCPTGYVTMGKVGQILPSACGESCC